MGERIIRSARKQDLPDIEQLDKVLFSYGTTEDPAVIADRLATFPEGFFVLEIEGKVAGYVSTEKWTTEREPALDEMPSEIHDPNGKILCITTIAVGDHYQNQGHGSALLNTVITLAKAHHCHKITLETARAQRFYEKHNFKLVAERNERGVPLYIVELVL